MGTWKGAFSSDDKECNTGVGLSRDSYYPSRKPGGKLQSDFQKARIFLQTDDQHSGSEWKAGQRGRGGFSGPVGD